jgi:hypothetical protein
VPALEPLYQEHMADYDELLPHVLMGDVTRLAMQLHVQALRGAAEARDQLTQLLHILEEEMQSSDDEVQELIAVSFLENLERDDPQFPDLRNQLGQNLLAALDSLDADSF